MYIYNINKKIATVALSLQLTKATVVMVQKL